MIGVLEEMERTERTKQGRSDEKAGKAKQVIGDVEDKAENVVDMF